MKAIEPVVIPDAGTATQLGINVTSDPCESSEDNSANVAWKMFNSNGQLLNNGTATIAGADYEVLNTGNYYDNVWNFVANFLNVVLVP